MSEVLVITPPAELDIASAPHLGAEGLERLDQGHTHLVLDFAGVRLVDSAGIGVLLSAQRRVAVAGGEIVVKNASGHVRRVFALTGVDRSLSVA